MLGSSPHFLQLPRILLQATCPIFPGMQSILASPQMWGAERAVEEEGGEASFMAHSSSEHVDAIETTSWNPTLENTPLGVASEVSIPLERARRGLKNKASV